MGPFPAPVVVVAVQVVVAVAVQVAVGVAVEVVAGRTAMAGAVVGSAAAAEQTVAVSDSWHDRTAKVAESEVAVMGWPDVRVAVVHTRLGTTSSGTVVVEVVVAGSAVSASGPGGLRQYWSGMGWVVGRQSSRPGVCSGFGEVWRVV